MNILTVIGNGFDLSVGAETSYSAFFSSDYYKNKRERYRIWIDDVNRLNQGLGIWSRDGLEISCWDLVFCMELDKDKRLYGDVYWCDVEQVIHDTLTESSKESFSWREVFRVMHEFYTANDDRADLRKFFSGCSKEVIAMCWYLHEKYDEWQDSFSSLEVFYQKIHEELKEFEQAFGLYICEQTEKDTFQDNARDRLSLLLYDSVMTQANDEDIIYLDSFNYTQYSNSIAKSIRHLNGDYNHPIFGIEITEGEIKNFPEIQRFTKTARRLYQDVFYHSNEKERYPNNIEKAVVFGHSLNRMDYDYFVYLFNLLKFNTFDETKMGRIQFAYSIYDSTKAEDIKNSLVESVYSLLNYYEELVSGRNRNILINMLRWNNKIELKSI